MAENVTPVIFRKFPDGDVIALFPTDPADERGTLISSFMHLGQHGAATPALVNETKLATPAEYADLKAELEAEPYRYRLKVCKRISKQHRAAREKVCKRISKQHRAAREKAQREMRVPS